ncbi:reticulon-1-A-like isoform X1 [Clarias magur]|uniref:Reticulon-1-A-like isoform X1 n=1 Tax=Clarias magur TaxID=1594786 RepID=A0A8J4TRF0_CLAMG|nr:reticulon-1-A-like isoform X1 [Clarias magur]
MYEVVGAMDCKISSTTEYLQHAGDTLAHDEFADEMSEYSDCKNFTDVDDILDLAGGAKDAIERHRSEDHNMDVRNVKIINYRPEKEEVHAEARTSSSQYPLRILLWSLFGFFTFLLQSLTSFLLPFSLLWYLWHGHIVGA